MRFDLDFEAIEHLLPEFQEDKEYKFIMKKTATAAQPKMLEIKADNVVIEYLSTRGYKSLFKEEHMQLLFNGSKHGKVKINFICPNDILTLEEASDLPRLRMRLIRADNLYAIPSRQNCPIIENLFFSYSYDEHPKHPIYAQTQNNFEYQDVTTQLSSRSKVKLFYNYQYPKPATYFGFDSNPYSTPLSLYFNIENITETPVDFSIEYLSKTGFTTVKVVDNTGGMLYSGSIMMVIPQDIVMSNILGEVRYFIRLIYHNKNYISHNLPTIKGIHMNMARVANIHTATEYFYVDDIDSPFHITLANQNLIRMRVFVNEDCNSLEEDNWVEWSKGDFYEAKTRVCKMDLGNGEIEFDKGVFANFPINTARATIRVDYRSYEGFEANVKENEINTLLLSIKSIADVTNPIAAFGGHDGYNEETTTKMIQNLLRTRKRAVTQQDYFDIISQATYGVEQIKCGIGVDANGEVDDELMTIAVLISEFKKGTHVFTSIKESIRTKLMQTSGLVPLGKTLALVQPYFVKISVRLWIECETMENIYDVQNQTIKNIETFLDPLTGGFEGAGYEIGKLPTMSALMAYLKICDNELSISKTLMTATIGGSEYEVKDNIYKYINNPFAMAVNGSHIVYLTLN